MMHTTNIITLLKTQETTLNAKIRETERGKTDNELTFMKILGMKLFNKIAKDVCNALWMLHLMKTSIFITKTPLTTLRSISKIVINK